MLVDFWTYSCINCIHTIPYVKEWDRKYRDQLVVGVHTPEYPFERDAGNVADAIKRFGIRYPVAQDNRYDTWRAYGNQYWPALYLIDANGKVVYTRYGEGGYDKTEAAIRGAREPVKARRARRARSDGPAAGVALARACLPVAGAHPRFASAAAIIASPIARLPFATSASPAPRISASSLFCPSLRLPTSRVISICSPTIACSIASR